MRELTRERPTHLRGTFGGAFLSPKETLFLCGNPPESGVLKALFREMSVEWTKGFGG